MYAFPYVGVHLLAGKDKARYFFLFVVLNFTAYFTIQYLTATHQYDFLVEFDHLVPLMPQFIWIYHSIVPISFVTMIFVINSKELFFTTFWSCVLAAIVLCICYILFPSFYLHRVKAVTEGKRHSLVCWFMGPPFQ